MGSFIQFFILGHTDFLFGSFRKGTPAKSLGAGKCVVPHIEGLAETTKGTEIVERGGEDPRQSRHIPDNAEPQADQRYADKTSVEGYLSLG